MPEPPVHFISEKVAIQDLQLTKSELLCLKRFNMPNEFGRVVKIFERKDANTLLFWKTAILADIEQPEDGEDEAQFLEWGKQLAC